MDPLTEEQALTEIDKWLDHKRVIRKKREARSDAINSLSEFMQDGILQLNEESFKFSYKLLFPIESGDNPLDTLEFKPRLSVGELHAKTKNVPATDLDGRLLAYVCALTSQPAGVIKKLDGVDYEVASAIAVFFM